MFRGFQRVKSNSAGLQATYVGRLLNIQAATSAAGELKAKQEI